MTGLLDWYMTGWSVTYDWVVRLIHDWLICNLWLGCLVAESEAGDAKDQHPACRGWRWWVLPYWWGQDSGVRIGGSGLWGQDSGVIIVATRVNLVMQHHKLECLVKRLDCCAQDHGNFVGSKPHWISVLYFLYHWYLWNQSSCVGVLSLTTDPAGTVYIHIYYILVHL